MSSIVTVRERGFLNEKNNNNGALGHAVWSDVAMLSNLLKKSLCCSREELPYFGAIPN